jgi:hypothetical protein
VSSPCSPSWLWSLFVSLDPHHSFPRSSPPRTIWPFFFSSAFYVFMNLLLSLVYPFQSSLFLLFLSSWATIFDWAIHLSPTCFILLVWLPACEGTGGGSP